MCVFFFKQKTSYELRISDWSSDVCSSDLLYTLLHRAIDRITNLPSQADPNFDPLSYAFDMGDLAVEFYVSDPDFFRPLLRFLFGVSDAELRPAFMNKGVRHW